MCMSLWALDPWETLLLGQEKLNPMGQTEHCELGLFERTAQIKAGSLDSKQDFPLTSGLYLTRPVSVQMSLERCTARSNVLGSDCFMKNQA